jgi:hypothetical protein
MNRLDGKPFKSKKTFKGGLKQKNSKITSVEAVMNMLYSEGVKVEIVSYQSISGFIFILEIEKKSEYVEFYGLNKDGTQFKDEIYRLIIKFVFLDIKSKYLNNIKNFIDKKKTHAKYSETIDNYKKEANTQQSIFLETIKPIGKPICPAVVDFSYFNSSSAKTILRRIYNLSAYKTMTYEVTNHMFGILQNNSNLQLGMITMELADGYKKISEIESKTTNNEIFICGISQIIILFVKMKIINYDAHMGNILGNETTNSTTLIDFGRIIDFRKGIADCFPEAYGPSIITEYNSSTKSDFEKDLKKLSTIDITNLYSTDRRGETGNTVANKNIKDLIRFILYIDLSTNKTLYNKSYPQMFGLLENVFGELGINYIWNQKPNDLNNQKLNDLNNKLIEISYKIKSLCESKHEQTSVSKNAIEIAQKEGNLFYMTDQNYDRSEIMKKRQSTSIITTLALIAALAGIIYYYYPKEFQNGGGATRKSDSGNNVKNQKQIIKIVIQIMKQYNCGFDINVADIDSHITPIDRAEFDEIVNKNADVIEYVDSDKEQETCDLNKIKIPHIEDFLKHVENQLKINEQIKNRGTRKKSSSKKSSSKKSSSKSE